MVESSLTMSIGLISKLDFARLSRGKARRMTACFGLGRQQAMANVIHRSKNLIYDQMIAAERKTREENVKTLKPRRGEARGSMTALLSNTQKEELYYQEAAAEATARSHLFLCSHPPMQLGKPHGHYQRTYAKASTKTPHWFVTAGSTEPGAQRQPRRRRKRRPPIHVEVQYIAGASRRAGQRR